jgi:hypothetical protein
VGNSVASNVRCYCRKGKKPVRVDSWLVDLMFRLCASKAIEFDSDVTNGNGIMSRCAGAHHGVKQVNTHRWQRKVKLL